MTVEPIMQESSKTKDRNTYAPMKKTPRQKTLQGVLKHEDEEEKG